MFSFLLRTICNTAYAKFDKKNRLTDGHLSQNQERGGDLLQKEKINLTRNKSREAGHSRLVVKNQQKQPPPSSTNLVVDFQSDPVEQPINSNNLPTSSPTRRDLAILIQNVEQAEERDDTEGEKSAPSFKHIWLKDHKNLSRLHFQPNKKKTKHLLCSIQTNVGRIKRQNVLFQLFFKIILPFQLSKSS